MYVGYLKACARDEKKGLAYTRRRPKPLNQNQKTIGAKQMKYRKKSVDVEAIQYTGSLDNASALKDNFKGIQMHFENDASVLRTHILTSSGRMNVEIGDWVIKGEDGKGGFQFWPVSDAYFKHHYEAVFDQDNMDVKSNGEDVKVGAEDLSFRDERMKNVKKYKLKEGLDVIEVIRLMHDSFDEALKLCGDEAISHNKDNCCIAFKYENGYWSAKDNDIIAKSIHGIALIKDKGLQEFYEKVEDDTVC